MAADIASRQVAWFEVYEYVDRLLTDSAGDRPTAGTPAWCALDDDDPAKVAAVLDAGVRWCLRLDTEQTVRAEASRAISTAADWSAAARRLRNYDSHRIRRAS